MYITYEVSDMGQDGTDKSVIGFCGDILLAERVSLGRGPMGNGDGEVREIVVWDSASDLPSDIVNRILAEQERRSRQSLDVVRGKAEELRLLLADLSLTERAAVIELLSPTLDDSDDDIPF